MPSGVLHTDQRAGYISQSVVGSYDNEAIAIFVLTFT
jgi:hypothetical protein